MIGSQERGDGSPEFPGPQSLAVWYGAGGWNLRTNADVAEVRGLWLVQSVAAGCRVSAREHRRGPDPQQSEGIFALPLDRPLISGRGRNLPRARATPFILAARSDKAASRPCNNDPPAINRPPH